MYPTLKMGGKEGFLASFKGKSPEIPLCQRGTFYCGRLALIWELNNPNCRNNGGTIIPPPDNRVRNGAGVTKKAITRIAPTYPFKHLQPQIHRKGPKNNQVLFSSGTSRNYLHRLGMFARKRHRFVKCKTNVAC
jgi:hypothetical protein